MWVKVTDITMNIAELKLDLFRKIDSLDKSKLEEAYGVMLNFLSSKEDSKEWDNFTKTQKDAIILGINELDSNLGRKNEDVLKTYRNKYPSALSKT